MILRKRRYCRRHGHDVNQDPGDFVLTCNRCHAQVDLFDLVAAARAAVCTDSPALPPECCDCTGLATTTTYAGHHRNPDGTWTRVDLPACDYHAREDWREREWGWGQ